jgi:hypothetical protein
MLKHLEDEAEKHRERIKFLSTREYSWIKDAAELEKRNQADKKEAEKEQVELQKIEEQIRFVSVKIAKLQSDPIRPTVPKVEFEVRAVTAEDRWGRQTMSGAADVALTVGKRNLRIEIKPAMGDDFPAVMRQMKASACGLLYLVEYTGTGATLDRVKKMFEASGMAIFMHADFEQHLPV